MINIKQRNINEVSKLSPNFQQTLRLQNYQNPQTIFTHVFNV